MAIIYSIGLPLIALIILVKNKDRLADPNVLQYIILLYQGLNHRMYFWELVNTFRKCTLLLLQAFIPRTFIATKILIGSGMIFWLSVIQARLRPFKIGIISDLGNVIFINLFRASRNGCKHHYSFLGSYFYPNRWPRRI